MIIDHWSSSYDYCLTQNKWFAQEPSPTACVLCPEVNLMFIKNICIEVNLMFIKNITIEVNLMFIKNNTIEVILIFTNNIIISDSFLISEIFINANQKIKGIIIDTDTFIITFTEASLLQYLAFTWLTIKLTDSCKPIGTFTWPLDW